MRSGSRTSPGISSSEERVETSPALDCLQAKVKVKLVSVCPTGNLGDEELLFFEEAKNPILTIEARLGPPENEDRGKRSLAAMSPVGPWGPELDRLVMQMKKVDLLTENLFVAKQEKEIAFDYSNLISAMKHRGGGKPDPRIYVFVCQDSDGDGRCSNESLSNQLTLRTHVFEACKLPKEIPIAVWAGCR